MRALPFALYEYAYPSQPGVGMPLLKFSSVAASVSLTTVATVVGMIADGMSNDEILRAYPDLEAEDIREALRFAAESVRERELPLLASS